MFPNFSAISFQKFGRALLRVRTVWTTSILFQAISFNLTHSRRATGEIQGQETLSRHIGRNSILHVS